jgi:coproporphyrinogen III oxidase-like Fe-S oxidoreductase
MDASPYQGYLYAYPHKTAYRPLRPRPALRDVWATERRDALFLYLHVPFCEMRCGFCNLFTRANPPDEQVRAYLRQLRNEAYAVRDALGTARFDLAAIGGGTPTYLTADELLDLLALIAELGAGGAPLAVETSPATATPERLAVLAAHGTRRISIGVQSFLDEECRAVNRPQRAADVHRALRAIRDAGPAILNVDLMYGLPGQTAATWRTSLEAALAYRPEELYLYPLYVRPLTTLGRKAARGAAADAADAEHDRRSALYDQGRDLLRAAGYRQISMRMFRREPAAAADDADVPPRGTAAGPVYCCQDDGMIGLGCGARSYTRGMHYSSEWAVGARSVREIIDRWIARPDAAFAVADHGFVLDEDEQRRRWLILSLLGDAGLDAAAYRGRYARDAAADFPELAELVGRGLAAATEGTLRLTPAGLARADAIGPWLASAEVRRRMAEYELA